MSRLVALLASLMLPFTSFAADSEGVKVGIGNANLNSLLQAWALSETTLPRYNFRLRRAEIGLTGSVADNTRWFVKIDPAKALKVGAIAAANDNKILQDLGVGFTVTPGLELVMGQFKTPTTYEGTASSAELVLPERSLSGRTYGDKREIGLMATYTTGIVKGQAMISNGGSTNADDTTDNKDLHLRVEVNPNKELTAGVFATFGDFGFNTKGRVGGNVRFVPMPEIAVRGELVFAKDAGLNSTGFMVDAAYNVTAQIQPVVRFDGLSAPGFTGTAIWAGANYLVKGHNAKATLAYAHLNNMTDGGTGTPTLSSGAKGHILWLVFQAAI